MDFDRFNRLKRFAVPPRRQEQLYRQHKQEFLAEAKPPRQRDLFERPAAQSSNQLQLLGF